MVFDGVLETAFKLRKSAGLDEAAEVQRADWRGCVLSVEQKQEFYLKKLR